MFFMFVEAWADGSPWRVDFYEDGINYIFDNLDSLYEDPDWGLSGQRVWFCSFGPHGLTVI